MTTVPHDVPRLVATDLDGTLLDAAGALSPRTRAVLEALDERGVPVVFTTGRPIRWMEQLWADVGGHGLAVCSNGGIVYDVARHRVRRHRTVPREVGLEIADAVRLAVPGTAFAVEHLTGWDSEPGFPRHPDDRVDAGRRDFADIYRDDVVKILALHRDLEPEEFWRRVDEVVGGRATCTRSSSFALVEMSGAGVTKASTLADLAAEMGIGAHEVVAFGDMPNDLPLLQWAGLSYAMRNAHPRVIEQADRLAPRHDEDGVAAVLADLFGLTESLGLPS